MLGRSRFILGKHFNGKNSKEFEKADGYEKCANVVRKAARLVGEIILERMEAT